MYLFHDNILRMIFDMLIEPVIIFFKNTLFNRKAFQAGFICNIDKQNPFFCSFLCKNFCNR